MTNMTGPNVAGQLRIEGTKVAAVAYCRVCQAPAKAGALVCAKCGPTIGSPDWLKRMGQLSKRMTTAVKIDLPDDVMRTLTAAATPEDLAAVELPDGEIPWSTPNGLMLLDTPTGDGRTFLASGYGVDTLPLSLTFNHDEDQVRGRMDQCDATGSKQMPPRASGVFEDTPEARLLAYRVATGTLKSISADLRILEYELELEEDEDGFIIDSEFVATKFSVAGASVVTIPGFEPCQIAIETTAAETVAASGLEVVSDPAAAAQAIHALREATKGINVASVITEPAAHLPTLSQTLLAAGGPVAPPREWFDDPGFTELTPLTVSDDGQRIWGHLAPWPTGENHTGCHIGASDVCLCAEPSAAGYRYFLSQGEMLCADNSRIAVGSLTLRGGHAADDGRVPLEQINAHYDNTDSAVAYVNCGDDEHGPWVAGVVRAGISDEDLQALRCSSPSVHEREIAGNLELVRVCMVNTPGLPVLRASGGFLPDFPDPTARVDEDGNVVAQVGVSGARKLAALKARQLAPPSRAEFNALAASVASLTALTDQQGQALKALDPITRRAALDRIG